MQEYFKISFYQDYYIIRCDAGARQDLFDEEGVLCTGPVIEAVVFRVWDDSEQEPFPIEFDSDNAMFSAYSADKTSLKGMADMMNRVFNDDDALRAVLETEEVKDASMLEKSLADISMKTPMLFGEMGLNPETPLSPEGIADILNRLF